jgi:hypothetical protein
MEYRHWTEEEIEYLRKNYANKTSDEIGITLNRKPERVMAKAVALRFHKSKKYIKNLHKSWEINFKAREQKARLLKLEEVKKIALRYKNAKEFRANENSAYAWAVNGVTTMKLVPT